MSDELNELEQQIEATRERLALTIDQLVYRASPKTIANRQAAQVQAFFVDETSGEPRTDNIAKVVGGVVGALVLIRLVRKVVN